MVSISVFVADPNEKQSDLLVVVSEIADHVLVMRAGQIVEQGPTEQVLGAPAHAYTQSLIDAAPVLPDYAAQSPKG